MSDSLGTDVPVKVLVGSHPDGALQLEDGTVKVKAVFPELSGR